MLEFKAAQGDMISLFGVNEDLNAWISYTFSFLQNQVEERYGKAIVRLFEIK